jgi:6-phosphofructokinase 1
MSTASPREPIRRVAILFSGGPAPAANAVISTAAIQFLRHNIDVVGALNGYSNLIKYEEGKPLEEKRDYVMITRDMLRRTRNSRGIMIGSARANPGKLIEKVEDLADPAKTEPLRKVHAALASLKVDALVSIGGDDTLKTANKFLMFQEHLPADKPRIAVVHVPKTIDNDYNGIDFTFGYFTAVDVIANEIRNLLADAEANQSYYLVEAMGRSAGWLAYGAAIAGEASYVFSVEDLDDQHLTQESYTDKDGATKARPVMRMDKVVGRLVRLMQDREKEGKRFGVIVLAEGIAEYLPAEYLEGVPRDDHGHLAISQVQMYRLFAKLLSKEFESRVGSRRKVVGVQIGYEARCAPPNSFDVMLGSQLGVGAYRALCEEGLNGVMVSVKGQLELDYVPFERLVDPKTLVTVVRRIEPNSDFHRLARFLETYIHE